MPIRFRCAYCNQLLGIARRKSGTVVRCPTCAGQVVVPASASESDDAAGPEQPLFERSDFDQVFKYNAPQQPAAVSGAPPPPAAVPAPPAGAWGTNAEPSFDVERVDPSKVGTATPRTPPVKNIVLSSNKATVITVAVILAVAVAFGAGFIVGRFIMQ